MGGGLKRDKIKELVRMHKVELLDEDGLETLLLQFYAIVCGGMSRSVSRRSFLHKVLVDVCCMYGIN